MQVIEEDEVTVASTRGCERSFERSTHAEWRRLAPRVAAELDHLAEQAAAEALRAEP